MPRTILKAKHTYLRFVLFLMTGVVFFSIPGKILATFCCDNPSQPRSPVATNYWYYDSSANECKNSLTAALKPLNCTSGETCLPQGAREQGICYSAGGPTPMFVTCGNIGQPCCRPTLPSLGQCNASNSAPDDNTSPSCRCVARNSYPGPLCDSSCRGLMGESLEDLGIACMQAKCNGCTECNNNPIIAHETIVDDCKNNNGPLSLECYINSVWQSSFNEIGSTLVGNYSDKVNSHGPSVLKGVGTMIASLYKNPPASGIEYFADIGRNFGFAKPAYAQGVGFTAMLQILPAWKAARNVAYVFFIIAFVLSGFAIMFRMKISPQTVISIQNALPKMIIALILVTFSYAIAGLLIDISYLFLYLAVLAFGQTGWLGDAAGVASEQVKLTNLNFWGGFGEIFGGSVKSMWTLVGAEIDSMLTGGPVIGGLLGAALSVVIGIIGTLVIWIVALVLMFKLFFSLVACYVQVVLLIFVGPILIAFDALPNGKNGFKNWLNRLMGNIMVFPGVAFMLMVGNTMASKMNISAWSPPLFGDSHDLAGPIFGFGILMMTAKLPEIIKGMFKIKDEGYGSAIGQAMKPASDLGWGATQYGANINKEKIAAAKAAGLPTTAWDDRFNNIFDVLRKLNKVK